LFSAREQGGDDGHVGLDERLRLRRAVVIAQRQRQVERVQLVELRENVNQQVTHLEVERACRVYIHEDHVYSRCSSQERMIF